MADGRYHSESSNYRRKSTCYITAPRIVQNLNKKHGPAYQGLGRDGEEDAIVKTCAYCAEAIPEDAQFCQFCGSNLAALGTPVAATGSAGVVAPEQVHTSGKAIASLICGIFFFVFPSAIIAIILGHLSYSEIGRSLGRIRGKGLALAGLILGYLGISFIPILIIAAIAIPNLLRARMAANEASAVGSLRSYSYALGFLRREVSDGWISKVA